MPDMQQMLMLLPLIISLFNAFKLYRLNCSIESSESSSVREVGGAPVVDQLLTESRVDQLDEADFAQQDEVGR